MRLQVEGALHRTNTGLHKLSTGRRGLEKEQIRLQLPMQDVFPGRMPPNGKVTQALFWTNVGAVFPSDDRLKESIENGNVR